MLENTGCSSLPQEDQLPAVTYMCYKCCSHGLGDVSSILVAIVGSLLAKKRQSGGAGLSMRQGSEASSSPEHLRTEMRETVAGLKIKAGDKEESKGISALEGLHEHFEFFWPRGEKGVPVW